MDEDRIEKLIDHVLNEKSVREAAKAVGMSVSSAYQHLTSERVIFKLRALRDAKLVAAYESGMRLKAIKEHFNVSTYTIYNALAQAGLKPSRIAPQQQLIPDDEIVQMYEQGHKLHSIAVESNRSIQYIYNVLTRHKVQLRNPAADLGLAPAEAAAAAAADAEAAAIAAGADPAMAAEAAAVAAIAAFDAEDPLINEIVPIHPAKPKRTH